MSSGGRRQTVGYRYHIGCHMVISHAGGVLAVRVGDRDAWTANRVDRERLTVIGGETYGLEHSPVTNVIAHGGELGTDYTVNESAGEITILSGGRWARTQEIKPPGAHPGDPGEIVPLPVGIEVTYDIDQPLDAVTENTTIRINRPELFGGESREGGVAGAVDLLVGGEEQAINDYLDARIDGLVPAFRGVLSAVLRQVYIGTNPYLKPWHWLVQRVTHRVDGMPAWYPERAAIASPDDDLPDMNPAHIVHEALTDSVWGLGYSATFDLDDASFRAAGDRFFDEGLGLSLEHTEQDITEGLIATVLEHVDAELQIDPQTGLWTLTPIRDDYVAAELPVADESVVTELVQWRRPGIGELTNQVTVVYDDRRSAAESSVTVHEAALIDAQAGVIAQTVRYPGVSNGLLATALAARELRTLSSALAHGELEVLPEFGRALRVGSVFRFSWPPLGIDAVLRVVEIDYGTLVDGHCRVRYTEDVFASASALYSEPPPTGWQPPNQTPQAADRTVFEAPYWLLATDIIGEEGERLADVVNDEGGYIVTLARSPGGDSTSHGAWSRVADNVFEREGIGQFVAHGYLAAAVVAAAHDTIELDDAIDIDDVEPGSLALLGAEWIAVLSVVPATATLIVARGVLDTPPVAHAAGTAVWFADTGGGVIDRLYFAGEDVDVRLTPITGIGELEFTDAPTDQVELDARALRPYPPGRVAVNDRLRPARILGTAIVAWAHRDRVQQTATLIDQDAGHIGPEPGTTYTVRVYDHTATLVRTETGISGTEYHYPGADEIADGGPWPAIGFDIQSVRDGHTSWRAHVVTVPLRLTARPTTLGTTLGTRRLYQNGDANHVLIWMGI